jgi:hypothetical protein
MITRLITTKGMAFPSSCFLSMWTRMGALLFEDAPKTIRRDGRRSSGTTAMHEARLGAPHARDPVGIA